MICISVYRKYKEIKHIDQVLSLIQLQMNVIKSEKSLVQIDQALREALIEGKRTLFFVAYDNENPVGFIFGNICSGIESSGDYFWINEIYVDEIHRGQRIAQNMIETMEEWLRKNKIKFIYSMTNKKNEQAKQLFLKLDFHEEEIIWIDKKLK